MLWHVEVGTSERKTVLKAALRTFPDSRTSFISDVLYTSIHYVTLLWLYLLMLANGLFLYNISNWNISLWTESRIRKGPIYSQLVLGTKKTPHEPTKKGTKDLTRPIMAIFAKVGIWKHKVKCCPPSPTWSWSSLNISLVLPRKLLSFAPSRKRSSAKQDLPPLVTHLLTLL